MAPLLGTSVAAGTPEALGAGGILEAGRAQAAASQAAGLMATMADARMQTLQKVPLVFCWADLENPYPLVPRVPGPGATGAAALPTIPTFQK
ncbi:MAG TPA: hypothetical protein VFN61_04535 [Acidimicrobiales bacterium]|nr:hypothetical protein [Acidimicrobiales bacterium]